MPSALPSPAVAGAWTQPKGHGLIVGNVIHYRSKRFFDTQGKRQAQPSFTKRELNPYAEWGWRDDITLGASLFIHELEQRNANTTSDNLGIGDSEIFARYRLYQDSQRVVSVQPLYKLPAFYREEHLPKAGSNAADAELSVLAGQNFQLFGQSHYLDARIGYRHRLAPALADQIRADMKLGIRLNAQWELQPAFSQIWARRIPANATFTQDGQNDYDLSKMELGAHYRLDSVWSVGVTGFSHIDGKNSGEGNGFMLSLARQF